MRQIREIAGEQTDRKKVRNIICIEIHDETKKVKQNRYDDGMDAPSRIMGTPTCSTNVNIDVITLIT